jgi:outer membrane protein assembly factor BamE (lipoprotein component of BamABCDE complex)
MKTSSNNFFKPRRSFRTQNLLSALMLAGALTACTPTTELRGQFIEEDRLASVKEGVDNRDSVTDTLGTPSAIATFDTDVWFYISTKQERFAFFNPKILERNIVAVEFDAQDNVAATRRYTLKDSRIVQIVGRETPTKGRELTFLEQMFGNFGRFSGTETATPGR